ncbi:hypothetical protein [Loigolactobacillus coryniformis]|uniref:Uncharacterized protein n=1 Tax=Loigolactobacillus coryniformis subsp. coryniformis KCTC 3167 = DSM 20001 TaxID=913848 RepID=A0A0R1EXM3_9LACO|nr:hypothetical protein [Loigolactobacillus coryniformis]OEH90989.1 hypothetical protein ATO00_00390 [Loigolactobacillus coryniformis subsp. coryniformis]ATO54514.1 hypothetical protein LC20001_02205 [Loigolactobacillus coryniformis subsp. coryniformis KCTC 3167 = DSM 20001]KRK14175.1 hypothetical protein FD22_GL002617 [Loigolactobacillus coryniformis subsp. coryniformis KCTC 3167 = DSM 20001]MBW4801586.1 hypothetical protein [Loigolactobacillus coryniformis subsp. torquens]MBW4804287.1 hypoth
MSKQDKPTSRVARHAEKRTRTQRNTTKPTNAQPRSSKPISTVNTPHQSFITRHRWSLIAIVVLIVAFGVYAEFSSIANDNQTAQPTTTAVSSSESSSTTARSSKAKSSTAKKSSSTTDEASTASNSEADSNSSSDTDSSESSSSAAAGDGQTFSSTSEAVAWGRANASSWMAEGYSNFNVIPNGNGGYTIEYTK